MKTIAIANQKGGVAKTTTAQITSTILNHNGKKTLAIDLDPQGNLSFAMGAEIENVTTIYDALKGQDDVVNIIQTTPSGDILPSNILLSGADMEFVVTGREYLLREVISGIKSNYEYIIIDCPPSLSILTINAFVTSDHVIVPVNPDVFSLQGLSQLNNTIRSVQRYCNPDLDIAGVLLTRYSNRTNLGSTVKDTLNDICLQLGTRLFKTKIRDNVAIREAQLQQKNVLNYGDKSNAVNDYIDFVKELEEVLM